MARGPLPIPVALLLCAAPLFAQSQPPLPRRTLSPAAATAMRERFGGEPFAALAAWIRSPRGQDPPKWLPESGGEVPPAFVELLHAALWSDDRDTAYAAACLLPERQLDVADIDRWLAAVWPHVQDEDTHWNWDTLKHVMSTADIHRLLREPPGWHSEIRFFCLGDLHRSMRPEHIPDLAKLTWHEDPFVRKGAWEVLQNLAAYTDQHRETIAKALLAWPGPAADEVVDQDSRTRNPHFQPRAYTLPAARPGWSPLLRAALERSFLDLSGTKAGPPFGAYLMRWAEDEAPGPEDRLLLAALLHAPCVDGVWTALRGITRLGADAHLTRLLADPPEQAPEELVLAARHDWPALRALAAEHAEALAVALEFDFEGTWLPWVAEAFGDDAEAGLEAIGRLVDASDGLRAPYRPAPRLTEHLVQAIDLFGGKLDHARLHALVQGFPAARSKQLLQLYAATITPQNLADCAAEVLEVAREVDFVGMLRGFARATDEKDRGPALDLLLQLGDHEAGEALLQHWQKQEKPDPFLLARCGSGNPLAGFLTDRLTKVAWAKDTPLGPDAWEALAAVGMVHDLPESVARTWAEQLAKASGDLAHRLHTMFPALRERVLAHDPADALAGSLAEFPAEDLWFPDLGLVKDERITELLRKVRASPGCHVQWAIGELALVGDAAAQRELDEVRMRHLYGWIDDATDAVPTMGRTLDYVPWLIGEIETICCRRNTVAEPLQHLTDFDAWAQPELGMQTQHARAAAWWKEVGGRLRWSRIARRFVVGDE